MIYTMCGAHRQPMSMFWTAMIYHYDGKTWSQMDSGGVVVRTVGESLAVMCLLWAIWYYSPQKSTVINTPFPIWLEIY